jgi:hypothetical protein
MYIGLRTRSFAIHIQHIYKFYLCCDVVLCSDRVLVGLATGTAVYLAALPPPIIPKITSSSSMFRGRLTFLVT